MTTLYWICLGGGFAVTLLLFLVGDLLDGVLDALDVLDGAFDPLALVAGTTVFGGAGLVLNAYASLGTVPEVALSVAVGVAAAVLLTVAYIRPMKRSENSTGFSQAEYAGKTGELSTSLTAEGFGEVVVRMGSATTFQTAASFDGTPIPSGARVVVVEVDRDGVLRVAALTADEAAAPDAAPRARFQTRA
jgi:membrane-bound ClpP family serine protease